MSSFADSRYQAVTLQSLTHRPEWRLIPADLREAIQVVAQVLPFRCNDYVMRELIDWSAVPDDAMFQLTFPQRGMLAPADYERLRRLLERGAPQGEIDAVAREIRLAMNPHPSGQVQYNIPKWQGRPLPGLQHKYRETVLFFPAQGQTCHAYCNFCFRWAQFVDLPDLKFQASEVESLKGYLLEHRDVSDLLFTGGDPMVMATSVLARYIEPLLAPELAHVHNLRIGTKALSYWPQRFVTDPDAGELLELFERIVAAGRHLAVMAHYNHPVELSTPIAQEAVARVRATGAEIRTQSPIIRHVNDQASLWAELWVQSVRLGMIPYYFFVERDTGPKDYFELPLVKTYDIYRDAYSRISGLARSARGPVMSALYGKVRILGLANAAGREVMVLDYLQARDPQLARRPFFARVDTEATWFDQLEPAFESDRPFFAPLIGQREPSSYVGASPSAF